MWLTSTLRFGPCLLTLHRWFPDSNSLPPVPVIEPSWAPGLLVSRFLQRATSLLLPGSHHAIAFAPIVSHSPLFGCLILILQAQIKCFFHSTVSVESLSQVRCFFITTFSQHSVCLCGLTQRSLTCVIRVWCLTEESARAGVRPVSSV